MSEAGQQLREFCEKRGKFVVKFVVGEEQQGEAGESADQAKRLK